MGEVLLSARGVTKGFKSAGGRLEVLRGVDLDIHEGEILAILGTSGCGKSTLLHVLGWLDDVDAGEILFEGKDRASVSHRARAELRNRVMGFVFQFYHLLPVMTAYENVELPLLLLPISARQRRQQVMTVLELVGLGDRIRHRPGQLSGGQQQRVAISRALVNAPDLILADEATGNLDSQTAAEILDLFDELHGEGRTIIFVTHEPDVARFAGRLLRFLDGQVVADEANAALDAQALLVREAVA